MITRNFFGVSLICFIVSACVSTPPSSQQDVVSSLQVTSSTQASEIILTSPLPQATITSPLVVQGKAKGTWYFEASFPVQLLDAHGQELASSAAQSDGDWMTSDFVPFTAELTFTAPTTSTGMLVLRKDNPSGDPEHDASVNIPIHF